MRPALLIFVALAQSVTPSPKFDVASVKPCDPNAAAPGGRGAKGGSAARFRRNCVTVMSLIQDAYVRFPDGTVRSPMLTSLTKVEGEPAWLDADQYTIEAESEGSGDLPPAVMAGPMTQSLLEDRFQLKVHREKRDTPVYELTVAKGGSKIQPAKTSRCTAADLADLTMPSFLKEDLLRDERQCVLLWTGRKGPDVLVSVRSKGMDDFTAYLSHLMDRPVVDKTGITGDVDLRLLFGPDESTPAASTLPSPDAAPGVEDPGGPSIFAAVQQQLGLKLEPARALRDYLVIDSVSRPTPN